MSFNVVNSTSFIFILVRFDTSWDRPSKIGIYFMHYILNLGILIGMEKDM